MKAFVSVVELYNDDVGDPYLIGKLTRFDDDSFSLLIEDKFVSPDDLIGIAGLIESTILVEDIALTKKDS